MYSLPLMFGFIYSRILICYFGLPSRIWLTLEQGFKNCYFKYEIDIFSVAISNEGLIDFDVRTEL